MTQQTADPDRSVRVVRVFTDETGSHGNPLGVVDGALVAPPDRQHVARALGFSETVFIDDPAAGVLRIFTPAAELPLAGHPLVGSAWLLFGDLGTETLELRPPGGPVRAWRDGTGRTWVEAPLASLPDWTLVELPTPMQIDELTGPVQADHDHVAYWSWIDAPSGLMRVRCFAPRFGIAEDQATGSAALRLVESIGRRLEIHQGEGSLLFAQPVDRERACVGGLVAPDTSPLLP